MHNIDCYRSLGRAVVIRAILDYQKARKDLRAARKAGRKQKIESCQATIEECTEFFNSKYCKVISNIDGRRILRVINRIELPAGNQYQMERLIFDTPRHVDYVDAAIQLVKEREDHNG